METQENPLMIYGVRGSTQCKGVAHFDAIFCNPTAHFLMPCVFSIGNAVKLLWPTLTGKWDYQPSLTKNNNKIIDLSQSGEVLSSDKCIGIAGSRLSRMHFLIHSAGSFPKNKLCAVTLGVLHHVLGMLAFAFSCACWSVGGVHQYRCPCGLSGK